MSDDEPGVDFLLRWKSPPAETPPLDATRDSVQVVLSHDADQGAQLAARQTEPEDLAEEWTQQPESSEEEADGQESFEWSCDREQAIIDALESAPAGAVPRVHQQLDAITVALETAVLSPERASQLLHEVETYLTRRVTAEQRKVPVLDPAFESSRADKSNALAAYQESVAALREYGASGESVQLKVARYAAEQGSAFLLAARDTLLAAEPDLDWDDDLDPDDDDAEDPAAES